MKTIKIFTSLALILVISCSVKKTTKTAQHVQIKPDNNVEQKERIAVLDFKTVDLPSDKSRIISELIRTDLINTNKYTVIERSQVDMIFKEHGFTNTGVTDDTNAAKIGKLLTAQKILIGSVMKLGDSIVVTARVVDVERGVADRSAKVSVANEESLIQEIPILVATLTGEEVSESSTPATSTSIHAVMKTSKRVYNVGEDIIITFKSFPGTRYDYISIAKENESAKNHYTYQYTNKQTEGTLTFYSGVNAAGKYEARAHTNYSKGDIQHTAVVKFTVK
jgi:TolB-like protein